MSVFNTNNLGYNLSPIEEKKETFAKINRGKDYERKKKVMIIICIGICYFIFLLIFLIVLLS